MSQAASTHTHTHTLHYRAEEERVAAMENDLQQREQLLQLRSAQLEEQVSQRVEAQV